MKARFLSLPGALQTQILRRAAACTACLALFALALMVYGDLWLCLSFAAFAAVFAAVMAMLLRRCLSGQYVAVSGVCLSVERTGLRRRAKSLTIASPPHTVKCLLRGKLSGIAVGDTVTLYIAASAPVYERDGGLLLDGCMAIEFTKGCSNGEHDK